MSAPLLGNAGILAGLQLTSLFLQPLQTAVFHP